MEKNKFNQKTINKKAQIASTLTWFVAFLVILFVIMLFLASTIILSKTKGINIKKDPIEYSSEVLESQRFLIFYLGSMQETLNEWADSKNIESEKKIKDRFDSLIDDKEFSCYIFSIESDGNIIKEMDLSGFGGRYKSLQNQAFFLEQGSNFILFTHKDNLIKIGFYGGKCSLQQ